jgi:hypothetical protein
MLGNNGSLRQNLIAEFRRGFDMNYEKALVISMFWSGKPKNTRNPGRRVVKFAQGCRGGKSGKGGFSSFRGRKSQRA